MVTLEFCSKDLVLAEYYERCFGVWFLREALELWPSFSAREAIEQMMPVWNERMLCEAKLQEHYDYYVDNDIRFPSGEYLIPEIRMKQVVDDTHRAPRAQVL